MPDLHPDDALHELLAVCAHGPGWDGRSGLGANPASLVLATALAVEASALGLVPQAGLSAQGNASLTFTREGNSAYFQVYPDAVAAGYIKGTGVEWDGELPVDTQDARLRLIVHLIGSLGPVPAPNGKPVRVRRLEWHAEGDGPGTMFHADTPIGRYTAWATDGDGFMAAPGAPVTLRTGCDADTAKASAQADFERRIRSALVED